MLAFYSQPFTRKSCGPKISYGIYFPATVARTPCGGDFDCGSSLNGPFTTAMDKDSTWTSTQHLSVSKKKRKKKLRKRIWVTNTYHMYSWVPPPISVVLMSPQQMRQAFAVRSWFHLAFLAVGSRGYWNVNRGLWQSTASKALQFSWRVVSRSVVRERFWILQRIERGHLQKESVHLGKTREREWKNILHKVVQLMA